MVTDPKTKPTAADHIARGVFFVLLFLAIFTYPQMPAAQLDASWRMVLSQALVDGWQFGQDIVFTYGPLGFLMGNTYSGVAFWPFILWQAATSLAFALIIYRQGMRLTGYSRGLYWGITILFGVGYTDALHMVCIALIGFELIRDSGRPQRLWTYATLILLGVLGVAKFTNLLLAGFIVVVAASLDFWQRRPAAAGRLLLGFFGTFLATWILCRQNPLNLPAYLLNSLEISSGYEQTMGLPTPSAPFWKGLTVLFLVIGYSFLHLVGSRDRARALAGNLVLGAFIYLNWKHGFVRADGHMIGFFICALLPITAFPSLFDDGARLLRWQRAVLIPAGVLCLFGIYDTLPGMVRHALAHFQEKIFSNVYNTAHFPEYFNFYREQLRLGRTMNDLPRMREVVGNSTLDVLGYNQAVAVLNRFNYQPRPVIQSYSAYTPKLAQLNADFYASGRAPDYILFRIETIDERYPALDDSRALYQFAHRYRYVLSERNFQLWQRLAEPIDAAAIAPRLLHTAELPVGEPLAVTPWNDQPLWVKIGLDRTLFGRLRDFFYKPPIVRLSIVDRKGNTTAYRMPLPQARAGFILNPMIEEIIGFMHFSGGELERRAENFTIMVEPADRKFLANTATIEIFAIKGSLTGGHYFDEMEKNRFHMFKSLPLAFEAQAPLSEGHIDDTSVMLLHAPSEMTFNIRENAKLARGKFGFLPGAYAKDANTDGAEFSVEWSNGAERITLFSRYLDPVRVAADRGLQSFEVRLSGRPGGRLFLKIEPGPKGNFAWDWTAWANIEID